jgi:hypothetical protein
MRWVVRGDDGYVGGVLKCFLDSNEGRQIVGGLYWPLLLLLPLLCKIVSNQSKQFTQFHILDLRIYR